MTRIISRRWSGNEHTVLLKAVARSDFLQLAAKHGFSEAHMQNWLRQHEVPVTLRAELRSLLCTWEHAAR